MTTTKTWQDVFRAALSAMGRDRAEFLAAGLRSGDPRLGRGFTVFPSPAYAHGNRGLPAERCCLLAYPSLLGGGGTVGEADLAFDALCWKVSCTPGFDRWHIATLTNWWDRTPPAEGRALALAEAEAFLEGRAA
jgi:hypothetical protein